LGYHLGYLALVHPESDLYDIFCGQNLLIILHSIIYKHGSSLGTMALAKFTCYHYY